MKEEVRDGQRLHAFGEARAARIGSGYVDIPSDDAGFGGFWVEKGNVSFVSPTAGHILALTGINDLGLAVGWASIDAHETRHAVLVTTSKQHPRRGDASQGNTLKQ